MIARAVLVVDDDDEVRSVLARFVASEGWSAESVSSGAAALDALAGRNFDLVLSDVDMPGLNGIQFLEAVRARDLDLPVILITGAPRIDTAIAAVEHGASHYLTKPVDLDRLRVVARSAMQARIFAQARRQLVGLADGDVPQIGDLAGLAARFDAALASIVMHYQPIVRWSDRFTFAYEALLRCGESTMPTPDAMFDAADRLGRTVEIGRRVRAALGDIDQDLNGGLLFVNLHTADLADESLYDSLTVLGMLAPTVVLEITERARLDGIADIPDRIAELRALGFRIAIDDIGAGYAGLTSFALLEPDFMKLDRGLVAGIDTSHSKRRLVGAMLQACVDLGVQPIGEGVETAQERDALLDLGCDLFQGFLFAKAGPPFVPPVF